MKNKFLFIVLAAVIGFSMITCKDEEKEEEEIPPEDLPVADRWVKHIVPEGTTATLEYSVDDDGVCTVIVGGTASTQNWDVQAKYKYTAKTDISYTYTFEAWTESGDRGLTVQYYYDNVKKIYPNQYVIITNTRKTYTVKGIEIPKGGIFAIEFHCANKLGTFYLKVLDIKEN